MLLFEGCSARDRTLPPKTKLVKEKVHTPQRAVAMPEHGRFNKNEKKKGKKSPSSRTMNTGRENGGGDRTDLNPLEKTGSTTTKEFRNKELRMVVDTEGEPPQETAEKSPPPTSKLVTTPASNET